MLYTVEMTETMLLLAATVGGIVGTWVGWTLGRTAGIAAGLRTALGARVARVYAVVRIAGATLALSILAVLAAYVYVRGGTR